MGGRLCVLLLAFAACSSGNDFEIDEDADFGLPGGEASQQAAEQGCRDVADAFGDMYARCGWDYEEAYDVIVRGVDGDCANVLGLRDQGELYGDCIPWMEDVSCDQVGADGFALDSACEGQLLIPE